MRVLVVDDEKDLCEILQYNLEAEGYEVVTALSADEALHKEIASFDLLLLDVMMEGMSGFELAKMLRARQDTSHIPIIFITALDGEDDAVRGLNLGADDYIVKPLSLRELKARVKAVLRRTVREDNKADEALVGFETLILDRRTKSATLDGERLQLTKLEFELLSLFLEHQGMLFDRDSLLRQCWPEGTVVSDRTVDVNIARLRKKIGRYGNFIKARQGYGYTFDGK